MGKSDKIPILNEEVVIVGKDPHKGHRRLPYYAGILCIPIFIILLLYHFFEMPLSLKISVTGISMFCMLIYFHTLFRLLEKKIFAFDVVTAVRKQNGEIIIQGLFAEFVYSPSMLVRMHPESVSEGVKAAVFLHVRINGRRHYLSISPSFENMPEVISILKGSS